jgi:hypothetical protein
MPIDTLPMPSASADYTYHTKWCDRDLYPEGTRLLCLYSPGPPPFHELVGEFITLSNDEYGTALRLFLMAMERKHGARFQTVENLL